MALSRPTCVSTWATAATSPIQEGGEGADSGFTWIVTGVCVILVVCPPLRETEIFTSFLTRRHISSVFSKLLLTVQLNNLVAHHVGPTATRLTKRRFRGGICPTLRAL